MNGRAVDRRGDVGNDDSTEPFRQNECPLFPDQGEVLVVDSQVDR